MEQIHITDAISETLFINIPMKAAEHRRPDGVLNDPYSVELMEKLDYDFSKFDHASRSGVGVVVRASYFDEQTKDFLSRNNDREMVIVHVGAGLDTRFLRIDGAKHPATFYELDLPDVMDLREKVLPPAENENIIKASMLETEWMDDLKSKHPNAYFFFVIEGVIFYFPEKQVRQLFCNLADRFSGEILCDIISVWLSKRSKKNNILKDMKATFDFGINDERQIESWHPAIKHVKSVSTMRQHPKRFGFFIGQILSAIPLFKNSSKMVTYALN